MALDVYLTNACNLRCKFCFNLDEPTAPQMPVEDVCQILEAAYRSGHRYVSITGGEPFIYRRIFEVLDFAHDLGFWIQILSHGGLLTEEKIQRLKRYWRLRVRISLDGADKETHDSLRGDGTFDKTLEKIERLVSSGITVGVGMTVSQHNISQIPNMVELCIAKGVAFLRMIPVARVKKGKSAVVDTTLHERILESIIEQSIKHIELLDVPPRSERPAMSDIDLLTTRRCMAGSRFFSVTSNKEILPCPLIYEHPKIPTLKFESAESFVQITKSMDAIFQSMEPGLKGICRDCEFRSVCYGGCIAEKLSFDRDLQDEQPVCTKKLLERISRQFPPEQLQIVVNSWVDRLTQSFEADDKHACMRQAPYWSVNFRARDGWSTSGARFN
jgi:radical SAM protein with 4Fe4S-binding SPASM domain